jgi:hypothetical protein
VSYLVSPRLNSGLVSMLDFVKANIMT